MANANHVVTGQVRLSYAHLLQPYAKTPGGEEKYSVTVLLPKQDVVTRQRIDAAIEAAISTGITNKWNGKRPGIIALPVYDGDGTRPSDGEPFGAECKGCWVFTASAKAGRPPRVVDHNIQDILDPREIYSGIWGRVGIDFFAYDANGKKGIGVGLTNVQKLADGEPLGSRTTAEDDFGDSSPAPAAAPYAAPVLPYAQTYQPPVTPAPYMTSPAPRINPLTGQAM